MTFQYSLLQQLSDAFGPPNDETDVKTILRQELNEFADQIKEDALGNLFISLEGDERYPCVMLAAHMDEVAFLITHIEATGFLRFHTLGGITPHVMPGQRIQLRGTHGPVSAIIGTKPPHIMSDEDRKKLVLRARARLEKPWLSMLKINCLTGSRSTSPVFQLFYSITLNIAPLHKS